MPDYRSFTDDRRNAWDVVWKRHAHSNRLGSYYHKRLDRIYGEIVPDSASVLEIGSGNGKLISSVPGREKTGVDFSSEAIKLSKEKYTDITFHNQALLDFRTSETFDYIILSDLVGDLWDVQVALDHIRQFCHARTRIVLNFYSKLWEGPLRAVQAMGMKKRTLPQNWLTRSDMRGLLHLSDYEVVRSWQEIMFPIGVPLLSGFMNRFLVRLGFFRHFAMSNFIIAKPTGQVEEAAKSPMVSIVVAARNEAGHIRRIIESVEDFAPNQELIFVEGGSTDNTYEVIEEEISQFPSKDIRLFRQDGKGKGDAVRKGFENAKGDVLMILDADLTVPADKLALFYNALVSGKGDFINGVRLVYPMHKEAMRFFNLLGNKFFSFAFSYLLGQRVRDTLCGTKVLWKKDYDKIAANRSFFGDFDPFGDFDLLFGAAKLNLRIHDLPIRYEERVYGDTNISRWSHGWLLLKMTLFAARKLKFR